MARMPQIVVPGYPHHATQRGNRRQKTFFCEDDYLYYPGLMPRFAFSVEPGYGQIGIPLEFPSPFQPPLSSGYALSD